ncbi:hypothetical protein BCR35DRAFT_329305 [Leucosporidium creatinivorum]|uniref:Uncharacterized protein n=1 Tax=Leucosporidium creatinivorum TaxID=106004 RepID=A0A1Y2G1H0_9BASI|nr:hypothetical protein BCR35DRAFT_329305 [Leucosporidium creatinivorum]
MGIEALRMMFNKKREWVEWFYELCWWHIWINVIFGIWWLFICSSSPMKSLLTDICVKALQAANSSAEALSVDSSSTLSALSERCQNSTKLSLILLDFWWAAAILIELWLVLIVGHTLDELEDWDAAAEGFDLEGPPPYRFVANSTGKRHSSKSSRSKSSGSQRSKSGRTAKSREEQMYDAV